eukprot:316494_1
MCCFFRDALDCFNGLPFSYVNGCPSDRIELWTDACLKGIGAFCEGHWLNWDLPVEMQSWDISLLEGFALVTAFDSFSDILAGKNVLIYVDNMVLQCCVERKWAMNDYLMSLVYTLCMLSMKVKCRFWIEWIDTKTNWMADYLSRGWFDRFFDRMNREGKFVFPMPCELKIPSVNY